ncbi:MAG: hypothetical protein ACTSXZ_01365, partial [Alphaproteobacteria bacterium]
MKPWMKLGLIVLAAGLLAAALLAPLQMMPFGRQQAMFAVAAKVIGEGGALYRDIYDYHPPGIFAWFCVVRAAVGPLEGHARLVEWIWMLLACLVAAALAYEWSFKNAWAALIAASLLALRYVAGGFAHTLQPSGLAALPLLLALAAWGRAGLERDSLRALAAGMLLGLGSLLEWGLAAVVPAIMIVELLGQYKVAWKTATRDNVLLLVGCLLPLGLNFVWLAATGDWNDFIQTQFTRWPKLAAAGFVDIAGVLAFLAMLALVWKNYIDRPAAALLLVTLAALWPAGEPGRRADLLAAPLAISFGLVVERLASLAALKLKKKFVFHLAAAGLWLLLLVGSPWRAAAEQWRLFADYLAGAH